MDNEKLLGKSGRVAVVDPEDAAVLHGRPWWWDGRYVKSREGRLHQAVIEHAVGASLPDGIVVDHRDGNPLNNRRNNLRVGVQGQNVRNSDGRTAIRKSKYKGVYKTRSGRWAAQFTYDKQREHLGTFDAEDEAGTAYNRAAEAKADEFLRLNAVAGYCGLAGTPAGAA